MDADARLEAVEAENEMLRDKIAYLEEMLGWRSPAPIAFGFTGMEAKVFGVLMKRDLATKEAISAALYADRPNEVAEIKIVDVFVCKMRRKLRPFQIEIDTVWGQGYRMKPETKEVVKRVMRSEGLAA